MPTFRPGPLLDPRHRQHHRHADARSLRVHHGYIGLLLLPLGWCFPLGIRHALWIIAIGLIVSDLMHHFLVLWPITGTPQFDFIYPDHPYWKRD